MDEHPAARRMIHTIHKNKLHLLIIERIGLTFIL
jgi:hypothetical protein